MKAKLFDSTGKQSSEIELPEAFDSAIREDISAKCFEAEKFELRQPYSSFDEAGKRHSASGTISHRRHEWKGHYGKGIARLPRKTMWRRGTQFFWIGAEVSQARGGRVAHPPVGLYSLRKINQKEKRIALYSALAATFSKDKIKQRYSSANFPTSSAVIESLPSKTKELLTSVKNVFGNASEKLVKVKEVRAGKGKSRGRKYKSTAGLLILTSQDEHVKCSLFDVKSLDSLAIRDLYPLGRIVLYTQKALDEISSIGKDVVQEKSKKEIKPATSQNSGVKK